LWLVTGVQTCALPIWSDLQVRHQGSSSAWALAPEDLPLPPHPKTLRDRKTRSNTLPPPLLAEQSPALAPARSESPAQSAAAPSSTASPTQNRPVKPPPPSQSSAAAPAQSATPRHTSREYAAPAPPATSLSALSTRGLNQFKNGS